MAENLLSRSPHLLQSLSLPPALLRLIREAVKAEPDFSVLAETVRLDPALAATILNLVNSAFYGLPQKVTDLNRAVAVLGSRELLKIAVAMTFRRDLARDAKTCGYDFAPDWRLIVWSSIAAELIAARLCSAEADQAYVSCLLKDVSLLFLRCAAPSSAGGLRRRDRITVLAPGQLDRETEAWGMHHAALSQMLLAKWGGTAEMCRAVGRHHALDDLAQQEPLAQAVILATAWSESELGRAGDPLPVLQFAMLLRRSLGLSETELEALRDRCREKFLSMQASLGLGAEDAGNAGRGLRTMQEYCFLCMDLLSAGGGLLSVARMFGRHVQFNWDVPSWDLALRIPQGGDYALFHLTPDGVLTQAEGRFAREKLPWRIRSAGRSIESGNNVLGELRLGAPGLSPEAETDFSLYLLFFAKGYAQYCARQAVLEEKARAFDNVPIGMARLDAVGIVTGANTRFGEFLCLNTAPEGRALAELLAHRLPPDDVAAFVAFLAGSGSESFGRVEYFPEVDAACGRPGGAFYLSVHRERRGDGSGVLALIENLRGLSEAEWQFLRRKDFLERLVTSMQELVLTVDGRGVIEFSSRPDLGLGGRGFFEVFGPAPGGVSWGTELLAEPPATPLEAVLHTPGGFQLPFELSFALLGVSADAPALGAAPAARECLIVGRDLTQLRRLEGELKKRALFDGLTGLFNFSQFQATLGREMTRSRRTGRGMGLVFFDLDHFKAINDAEGHLAGDAVLKAIGGILLHEIRQGLDYPCRYGGDEFAVIVTEADAAVLRAVGERILAAVRREFRDRVGVSMGCAMLAPKDTAEGILRRADEHSYQAKRAGGGVLVGP